MSDAATLQLLGCDFTSAPGRRKPITLAVGRTDRGRVLLDGVERIETLDAWSLRISAPGRWVGGFDLPFGLPRELVTTLDWPTDWAACMAHYGGMSREAIRETFAAFCDARPVGSKFAHRATDRPAGSSPSMKWVNPPVAFMLLAGVPRLIAAGVTLPGLLAGDGERVGLEAYPGLLARSVLGTVPYKSDEKAKQTPQRLIARKTLINALENGQAPLLQADGLRLKLTHAQRDALADDARGDSLDAVLCLLQAAWAEQRHRAGDSRWGLPDFDPLEGWIVSA
ncbi:MAG: DUF429 domain-containing protein [Hydrogenophaga sp.]|jgi:hypothetical protein|uniref:DUF429 domain-containing protein n=1 Tax=Hydrogenophaga sp. TaxID=1904254 RepID=UPI00262B1F3F|nr:DUF429 domain-containing protein [Hydrogenophaga sp.]MCV0440584.1 DUF429 domain-containing protein [Hydrogenophaga sp.]